MTFSKPSLGDRHDHKAYLLMYLQLLDLGLHAVLQPLQQWLHFLTGRENLLQHHQAQQLNS